MMKLLLLAFAIVCCAHVSSAQNVQLTFVNPTPQSVELHWTLPVKVAGIELRLGNMDTIHYTGMTRGPALPTSWSISQSMDTGKMLVFSMTAEEALTDGSNDGKILDIHYESTTGTLALDMCGLSSKSGETIGCILPEPFKIPGPPLSFRVTAISSEIVTVGYTLENWEEGIAFLQFAVEGMDMMSAQSAYDYGVQCTKVAPHGQMVCTKPITSANIPEGDNDDYVTFTQTPNSGGRTFKIVDVKLQNNRQASADSNDFTEFFTLSLPAPAQVPKISIGIESVEAVDASTETCFGSEDVWKKQKNKVKITYVNHDTTVLIAGFELTLEAASGASPIEWFDYGLPENLHGFSVSSNDEGKFVAFNMQGHEIPASAPGGSTLFVAHINNYLADTEIVLKDVVLSDKSGNAIASINLNGGHYTITGCDDDGDDLCDLEDEDGDCCLNNVDGDATNAQAGCGFCSDVDDNKDIDIVDVVRTVNMVEGIETPNNLKGDGNGDDAINVQDVLLAVSLSLDPPAEMESRPCGLFL